MSTAWIVTIIILAVSIALVVVLYFLGKKAQKRQAEQEAQMEAYKQSVSMLIIDKKKMRLNEAGLPQAVIDQAPKLMRRAKLPIVKAKVGPQIMSLVCDDKIFDSVPVKKEVKAVISGIYITEVKGLHGKSSSVAAARKKGFKAWVEKMQEKAGAKSVK
ncbi:MAG: hypothetical protein K6A97_08800 [Lachnospiraceae bacterium]|nr:hypothetical protein [Lachnospiraceae bacterium]